MRKLEVLSVAGALTVILLWVALWIGVISIAVHFIRKFW